MRVDDTTVRRWIKNGVLEAVSLPHSGKRESYRIKRSTVEAILSKAAA
ncbi:MAG TPA: helix-turn-helix domain-containing protein [Ktedonobacteraceae bacterium]|nr:helix-turn-helix domain-containing protein [Ktedonobacteraceae bacterium]